ncbi:MAG TPA: cytochrome c, partial [Bdellovibrionota bacterium]|nr:cytochrome c [Bdellovibrionota bacterium]
AKVDLVNFQERFPKLAPPAGSKKSVMNGFLGYRTYCMSCHPVNGETGGKARNLTSPKSIIEDHPRAWLTKFILDPNSVRPGFPMPGLSADEPHREQLAKDILEYLDTIGPH